MKTMKYLKVFKSFKDYSYGIGTFYHYFKQSVVMKPP